MTIKARQADEPGSAVTVTPTAVPTYATYCSNPLACKFKRTLCPLSHLPFFLRPHLLDFPPASYNFPLPFSTLLHRNSPRYRLLTPPSLDYSACSCAGATPITTTMPTPTVTVTEQASITCALKRKVKRGLQVVGGVFDYGRM